MKLKKNITGIEDIKLMVDQFYKKVKTDELLSPIFLQYIPADWQPHSEKMYLFWNAALFGEKGYMGNPFSKHAKMDTIGTAHFERWLFLFYQTIDEHFIGSNAKWRASVMADNFMRRLASIKQNGIITIV
ncbi:group III truncated hemoglobin [Ferruginibacter sp.]|uniref:group III truncated hemoglobin n=1 Tax=Ferruginibacter sp. TaxID=1940288 RepID=UPI00199E4BB2|nr:group III truncated hemoglobin [Ferruginibacter sp.]MBC7625973.1 group III truncated hemoglobin [Ferruginibacter sp.]